MKAVYVTSDSAKLTDVDVPVPDEGEVLVKNVAVASNPKVRVAP
jgi:NADPH:quinone reductase-like Zn-dependent oxidoreductase